MMMMFIYMYKHHLMRARFAPNYTECFTQLQRANFAGSARARWLQVRARGWAKSGRVRPRAMRVAVVCVGARLQTAQNGCAALPCTFKRRRMACCTTSQKRFVQRGVWRGAVCSAGRLSAARLSAVRRGSVAAVRCPVKRFFPASGRFGRSDC